MRGCFSIGGEAARDFCRRIFHNARLYYYTMLRSDAKQNCSYPRFAPAVVLAVSLRGKYIRLERRHTHTDRHSIYLLYARALRSTVARAIALSRSLRGPLGVCNFAFGRFRRREVAPFADGPFRSVGRHSVQLHRLGPVSLSSGVDPRGIARRFLASR